jgi:hypothetical protein
VSEAILADYLVLNPMASERISSYPNALIAHDSFDAVRR